MSNKEWGNITWSFFHTLAARIDESKFHKIRNLVIDLIIDTCKHLPCPVCREDATNIINKSYIQNIQTKRHLVEFLRQLHNIVNIKLHKKIFTEIETKNRYINYNLNKVFEEFTKIYSISYHNMKLNQTDFHKKNFIQKVQATYIQISIIHRTS